METIFKLSAKAIIYILEKVENDFWISKIKEALAYFDAYGEVRYYLNMHGGMGSLNDLYFENKQMGMLFDSLKSIAYCIAYSIGRGKEMTEEECYKMLMEEEKLDKKLLEMLKKDKIFEYIDKQLK